MIPERIIFVSRDITVHYYCYSSVPVLFETCLAPINISWPTNKKRVLGLHNNCAVLCDSNQNSDVQRILLEFSDTVSHGNVLRRLWIQCVRGLQPGSQEVNVAVVVMAKSLGAVL